MIRNIIYGPQNEMHYTSILKKMICGAMFWVAAHVPYDFHEGKGAVYIPRTYHNAWDQIRCSKTILRKIKREEQEKKWDWGLKSPGVKMEETCLERMIHYQQHRSI